jgi:outer membrane lipoprotein
MNTVKHVTCALLALALLSGCASYPISDSFRQQAKQITLDQVRADPQGTRGTIVIWGGRIINVVNDTHGSAIYIVCLPLPQNEKPIAHGPSPGRFIATSTGFLDPEMFPYGGLVTIAGQLDGVRIEQLQNMQYPYPVLQIQETHVWPMEPQGYYPDYNDYDYGYGPGWYGGYWWPYWWWWGGYPYYYGGYYRGFHGGYHGFHGGGGFRGGGGGGGGFRGGGFGGGGGGGGHGR